MPKDALTEALEVKGAFELSNLEHFQPQKTQMVQKNADAVFGK